MAYSKRKREQEDEKAKERAARLRSFLDELIAVLGVVLLLLLLVSGGRGALRQGPLPWM